MRNSHRETLSRRESLDSVCQDVRGKATALFNQNAEIYGFDGLISDTEEMDSSIYTCPTAHRVKNHTNKVELTFYEPDGLDGVLRITKDKSANETDFAVCYIPNSQIAEKIHILFRGNDEFAVTRYDLAETANGTLRKVQCSTTHEERMSLSKTVDRSLCRQLNIPGGERSALYMDSGIATESLPFEYELPYETFDGEGFHHPEHTFRAALEGTGVLLDTIDDREAS